MRGALAILGSGLAPRRLAGFTASLLLLAAAYYAWLRLPDSNGLYLALQGITGLALLAAAGALVAGTVASLAGFGDSPRISHLWFWAPIGASVLTIAAAIYWLAALLEGAGEQRMYVLSSWLSYHFNHAVPISPFRLGWDALFLFVYLVLVPAVAIRALSRWLRHSRRNTVERADNPAVANAAERDTKRTNFFFYWALAIAMAVIFDWLPWKLASWVPVFHRGWAEVFSAALRLGTAGLAFVCGLVIQWSWYLGKASPTQAVAAHACDQSFRGE